jgi:hypothetical protein
MMAGDVGPTGVEEQGTHVLGSLGNMGGPVLCAWAQRRTEGKPKVRREGRESESAIVPTNRGNRPVGPWGGKGGPMSRTCWRDRCQRSKALQASQRNNNR